MGGRATDTRKCRHTDRHINTMTQPGVGAGPSENDQEVLIWILSHLFFFRFIKVQSRREGGDGGSLTLYIVSISRIWDYFNRVSTLSPISSQPSDNLEKLFKGLGVKLKSRSNGIDLDSSY